MNKPDEIVDGNDIVTEIIDALKSQDEKKLGEIFKDENVLLNLFEGLNYFDSIVSRCKKDNKPDALEFYVKKMPPGSEDELLNKAIRGFVKHQMPIIYVENLIARGADINEALKEAIITEQYAFARTLVNFGAAMKVAKSCFAHNKLYLKSDEAQYAQAIPFASHMGISLSSISCYSSGNFSQGYQDENRYNIDDLRGYEFPNFILNRVNLISSHMKAGESYSLAYARTDKSIQRAFVNMVLFLTNKDFYNEIYGILPVEIFENIFNQILPYPLTGDEIKGLISNMKDACFKSRVSIFNDQLSIYKSSRVCAHRDRAESLQMALQDTKNEEELETLVKNQVQILQGKNPYEVKDMKHKQDVKNTTPNNYHAIIGLWSKSFTGEKVVYVEESTLASQAFSLVSNFLPK